MDYGTGETDMGKAAIRAIKALEFAARFTWIDEYKNWHTYDG